MSFFSRFMPIRLSPISNFNFVFRARMRGSPVSTSAINWEFTLSMSIGRFMNKSLAPASKWYSLTWFSIWDIWDKRLFKGVRGRKLTVGGI
jgi:hypothetical protein